MNKNSIFWYKKTGYEMNIFIMQQRKGSFTPIVIEKITKKDLPKINEYLLKHYNRIKKLWNPLI